MRPVVTGVRGTLFSVTVVVLTLTVSVLALSIGSRIIAAEEISSDSIDASTESVLSELFPDADAFEAQEIGDRIVYLAFETGEPAGRGTRFEAAGYGGAIEVFVAVDRDGKIIAVRVLSHSETPGLGDVITSDDFLSHFAGMSAGDPIEVGHDIDLISGATASVTGVTRAVRSAIDILAQPEAL